MRKLEFKPCRKCMGKKHPMIKNYYIIPKGFYEEETSDGQKVIVECDCHKNFLKELRSIDIFNISNIPLSFKEYNIDREYLGLCKSKIENLKKFILYFDRPEFRSAVLYFYGDSGTQKSYTAKWLGAQLINSGYKVYYTTMLDLISGIMKINDEFKEETDNNLSNRLYESDFLIVDDSFDKDRITLWKSGYQIQFLDSFIRKRLNSGKGMLFISGNKYDQISGQGFSSSIQSMITRNVNLNKTAIEFTDYYDVSTLNPKGLFDEE